MDDDQDFFHLKKQKQKIQEQESVKDKIKETPAEQPQVIIEQKDKKSMSVNWKPSQSVVSDGRSSKNSKVVGKKRGSTSEKKIIKEIKNPELMVEQAIGKPYFIVPDKKTETKKDTSSECEENRVRRWEVSISEIKLENLQKEDLTVFLNFRIGLIGLNKQKSEEVSSEEIFFKSEIVKEVKRSEVKSVKVIFECEMNLSYQMLKERYFVIEIWEYRRFLLNLYLGQVKIPLVRIVSGSMARQESIKKATGEKRQFARIYYKILFQEVWDYKLTFEAWKATNIMGDGGDVLSPKIQLILQNQDKPTVQSHVVKNSYNPNFKDLKGFMHYRGTIESLTEQMILIVVYKDAYFEFCRKLVSLRGIQDTNYIKSQFRLNLKEPPPSNKQLSKQKQKQRQEKKDLMRDSNDGQDDKGDEGDEDLLTDNSIYCVIEGRLNLNRTPRYSQIGELNRYVEGQYYLVITINRLEKVLSPDDRGVINTFLSVNWRDQQKTTQVMKDNSNPTFNEELYFRIPILVPKLTLDDILNQKTVDMLTHVAIREEIRNRPDINIQLWLDGAEILSDESLGFCRVFLSEIQNATKQPKSIVTHDNQKRTFETRVQSFKKKFTSGLFNLTPITVHFQACFVPDLPETIDLSDFNKVPPDFYPIAIADQMEIDQDWRKKNNSYKQWDKNIRDNFSGYGGIEKNSYNLFFNSIFVKDQYDYIHLVCKYLEKFYIRFRSQEATKELFADPADISLSSLHELVHFVRNIPFINDQYSKREVWMSPDFLLRLRKGFPHDHAVLAACLFMGCEQEEKEVIEKNGIPLEHRTFVCLGTLRINNAAHAWVMTFSSNLDKVILWDVQDNLRFEMVGRVQKKYLKKMNKFLYPDWQPIKEAAKFFQKTTKKPSRKQLRGEKLKQQENLRVEKELMGTIIFFIISISEKKEKEDLKKKEDESRSHARKIVKFEADNQEIYIYEPLKTDDIKFKTSNIKNMRQTGNAMSKVSVRDQMRLDSQKKNNQQVEKAYVSPFQKDQYQDKQGGVLGQRLDEQERIRKLKSDSRFTQAESFTDLLGKKVTDGFVMPYATMPIIFNQKNIYGNLGNQNPQEIFYHLNDKKQWLPYVMFENLQKDPKAEDEDENEDEEEEEEEDQNNILANLDQREPWNQKIGAFYSAQILGEPIRKQKVDQILDDIYYEIKEGIVKARAKAGLVTKWKHNLDVLNSKMLELIRILEYRDTNRPIMIVRKMEDPENVKEEEIESNDYVEIMDGWKNDVKKIVPVDYKLELLPIRFTFTQSEKMRTIILENMSSFFMLDQKKIIFNIIGKIYNYPNRVNCVRLILGYTYSLIGETLDEQSGNSEEEEQAQLKTKRSYQQGIINQIDEDDDREQNPLIN